SHFSGEEGCAGIADCREDPAGALEGREMELYVQRALSQLDAQYRVLIILCDMEGKSYEQAAAVAGVPVGTVKSRLSRGRSRLRALLEGTQ
ncbi:MAG: RNA polymerase sigma factor, partial [Spirochaetota bacterium]